MRFLIFWGLWAVAGVSSTLALHFSSQLLMAVVMVAMFFAGVISGLTIAERKARREEAQKFWVWPRQA